MKYRPELDGLRAIAVISVILFHAGIKFFRGGFVGVDIFFVISGFLISSNLFYSYENGDFRLFDFYERRIRRILPALFLVLFVSSIFAWFTYLPGAMKNFSGSLASISIFVSNFYFYFNTGYFGNLNEGATLLHTWSLSLEEQFYIFYPLFFITIYSLSKKYFLYLLWFSFFLSLFLSNIFVANHPSFSFYLLPTRSWEILSGVLTAIYIHRIPKSNNSINFFTTLGLFLILVAICAFNKATPTPSFFTLIPVLGTCFIILFGSNSCLISKFLASRPLVFLGLISYSAYLWHEPIFSFAVNKLINPQKFSGFLIFFCIVLTLIFAYISWRYVEKPFRDSRRFSRNFVLLFSLIISLSFLFFGFFGYHSGGYPWRLPKRVIFYSSFKAFEDTLKNDTCNKNGLISDVTPCLKGDLLAKPKYALLGDSHAASLAHSLNEIFMQKQHSFLQFTKNGCPFAMGLISNNNLSCSKYISNVINDSRFNNIETVIISSRWSYYLNDIPFDNGEGGIEERNGDKYSVQKVNFSEDINTRRVAILNSYKESIVKLLDSNKKVILVYPIPEQAWNIPDILAKNELSIKEKKLSNAKSFSILSKVYYERNQNVIVLFNSLGPQKNLYRIYPSKIFCDSFIEGRCASNLNNQVFYADTNHLTKEGSDLVANDIIRVMGLNK